MGTITGNRILNQIISGAMTGAQLQTALGAASSLAGSPVVSVCLARARFPMAVSSSELLSSGGGESDASESCSVMGTEGVSQTPCTRILETSRLKHNDKNTP